MRTRIVFWATDNNDKRILVGLELKEYENKVVMHVFGKDHTTDEFEKGMMTKWRSHDEFELPEEYIKQEFPLPTAEALIPEEIRPVKPDLITRTQSEWMFIVLSAKMQQQFESELDEITERINRLEKNDRGVWNELKGFWEKVQRQITEKNMFREHSDNIRKKTNELFEALKELRAKEDEAFQQVSQASFDTFAARLDDLDKRINEGSRLNYVFNDLRKLQSDFKETKFAKDHRQSLWQRIDATFKVVKEKRFGVKPSQGNSPVNRLNRRLDGLVKAIEKMESSISRDRKDFEYETRRIDNAQNPLEQQIRQAKLKMIEDRIASKQAKLDDMNATQVEINTKIDKEKAREAKLAEKAKVEAAMEDAKAKIQEEIEANKENIDSDKLEKAADLVKDDSKGFFEKATDKIKSMAEDIEEKASEIIETAKENIQDVIETDKDDIDSDKPENAASPNKENKKKGFFDSIKDRVEDFVDEAKEELTEVKEKVEKTLEPITEKIGDKVEEVVDDAKPLVDKIKEQGKHIKEEISDSLEDLAENAEAAIKGAKEGLAEKKDNIDKGIVPEIEHRKLDDDAKA